MTEEFGEIVEYRDGKPMISSLQIAERFSKQHKDVLRAIQSLEMSAEFNRRNFAPITYRDARNREQPAYLMTRDGFWALAMTFTGKEAARLREKIIDALNRAEEALRQQVAVDVPSMMRNLADEFERMGDTLKTSEAQGQRMLEDRSDLISRLREAQREAQFAKDKAAAVARHAYKALKEIEEGPPACRDLLSPSEASNVTSLTLAKDNKKP